MVWADNSLVGAGTVASCLKHYSYYTDSLADDGTITLPICTDGAFGFCMWGDNAAFCIFNYTSAGVVTIDWKSSANIVATDTDTKYCIYDGGTSAIVKNRSGAALAVKILLFYS